MYNIITKGHNNNIRGGKPMKIDRRVIYYYVKRGQKNYLKILAKTIDKI